MRATRRASLAALQAANRELRSRYHQLREEARRDARTGLLRDDAFEDHLQTLRGAGIGFSVAFVDIDLFHGYNERYTHIAGNEALAAVASTLQGHVGVRGSVFRYGGEEFTIVIPRTEASSEQAEELAEGVPEAVVRRALDYETSPFGW